MKKYLLMGIIVSAYGISVPVFASDTATLTISGKVTAPTCSTEVVNAQLQQHYPRFNSANTRRYADERCDNAAIHGAW